MIWFCDASALVKRYIQEVGSRWFRREVDRHTVIIAHITVVEVHAALAARYRTRTISLFSFYQARHKFADHVKCALYQIQPLTEPIVAIATALLPHHPLRAYDAVQLATALDYLKMHPAVRPQFCFLTADDQLERAAIAEGLKADNPNRHRR
ncbi:MAG: type II toxin-antitoxin system VapC family toxin [Acidobacteriota bacterium]|nr:type II toxin-antitoxin system VapC family toxin [Blastocatellia bacterium]MDW8240422.1 type II toxin-antitoxin system VapC family toxin [Acidobacteriota bacterium]